MIDDIDFSKKYEYNVDVYHDDLGELGNATLSFGAGNLVHLHFKNWLSCRALEDEKTHRIVKAKTSNNEFFTLFDCVLSHSTLYANYVIAGDVTDEFKCIEIRYSNISEWFMSDQGLKGEIGKTLKWVNTTQQFFVSVKTNEEEFSLTSKSMNSITQSGENYSINEHILFSFERLDARFAVQDVKDKAYELSNFLSILIAYPLSIVSIQVECENERTHCAYFPTFKKVERDESKNNFWLECLISKSELDGKWQAIFENYYKSVYRKISWFRLAGMQRYEGFWEYKTLGYVTLLDKYVTEFSKANGLKTTIPGNGNIKKLGTELTKIKPSINDNLHNRIMKIADSIFSKKREPNFIEKYEFTMNATNSDIVKIINLSAADFKRIKDLRDAIAHGHALEMTDNDYDRMPVIVAKIALLLTYWAFIDFGLKSDDFMNCLTRNHNQLRRRADPDLVHLARIRNPEKFFMISQEEFEKISRVRNFLLGACFTEDAQGALQYSEQHAETCQKWWKNSSKKTGRIYAHKDIFSVKKKQLKIVYDAYVECGDKQLVCSPLYIFTDSISSSSGDILAQSNSG
ncbi:HEPN domain-containing protein [Collimonas fungivorans]|nr:HEPN domain-containing protein [Collimonas fungivorans]